MYEEVVNELADKLRNHDFLQRCRNGDVSDSELKVFLAQHGKYSNYFTRFLCALIGNLESKEDAGHLAENLAEELGYGGSEKGEPHSKIFARMASGFGVDIEGAPTYPETEVFIDTLMRYCKAPNPAYGLGALCLGIEAIVPKLYGDLIDGFTKRGANSEDIYFFRLHVECDDGHADTMRDILQRMGEENPEQYGLAKEAAEAVINARLNFFNGVVQGARMS
jgi:pyrroloquinoline-quinone synthase